MNRLTKTSARVWITGLTVIVVLSLSAVAYAAFPKPSVTTGAATNVTATSALVHGTIKPNGQQTDVLVQYGPTTTYGLQTVPAHSFATTGSASVALQLVNLAADTLYHHYRLVVSNPSGIAVGADKTFTTAKIPLSLGIAATPNPIPFLAMTTVSGTLAGSDNGNREVVLQQNAFPFTAGFANVGNPELTHADGSFSFAGLAVPVNTQYRVVSTTGKSVVSPVTTVQVAVDVTAHVNVQRARHGSKLRFRGTIAPAEVGSLVEIQRLTGTQWLNVATSTSGGAAGALTSTFDKTVKVRKGGFYRVWDHINDGGHISNGSVPMLVSLRHH